MTISVLDHANAAVEGVELTELQWAAAEVADDLLPCRVNDAELWFAESPRDVEFAKTLCADCPVRDSVWMVLSPGESRGAYGVDSSSCKEW